MNFIQFPSVFETYTSAPDDDTDATGSVMSTIQTWEEYLKRANLLYENPFLTL